MSINRLTGYKRQELLQPGIDNNNFVRFQDLNNVIDDINIENTTLTEAIAAIPAAKQRMFEDGISNFSIVASTTASSENIIPEDYDEDFTACAVALFSFSGSLILPLYDSLNSVLRIKRNASIIRSFTIGADTDGLVGSEDGDIAFPISVKGKILNLLPSDVLTIEIVNSSATKPILVQFGAFEIEEL
jgi:hypothetical protein